LTISPAQINLLWQDNSRIEQGFNIERKTGGGTWAQIATVGANVTSCPSTGLLPNTTYYYRVRAYNASGNSAYSNETSSTTPGVVPLPPSNLTASPISPTQINLFWQDNSNNEQGFKIERKTGGGGTWAQIATVGANVTSYQNTGLSPNTTYYYRVRAYSELDVSSYSNEASGMTPHAAWGGRGGWATPGRPSIWLRTAGSTATDPATRVRMGIREHGLTTGTPTM
jgi:transcriptional regulator CtsR